MTRKTWPIIVGGVAVAGAAAVISIVVLDDGEEERKAREQALVVSKAAELEREAARLHAEAKLRAAQEAALAAAEEAKAAAEAEAAERARQTARAEALEQAKQAGILGQAALAQGGAFAALTGTADISSGFDDTEIVGGLLGNEAAEAAGGFTGGSGFGPGGGGAGWGEIGTGRYGTLGHGSGTGQPPEPATGRAGLAGGAARRPTMRIDVTQVTDGLDEAVVRRIVRSHATDVNRCYEAQLTVEPDLSGTVTVRFTIADDGIVSDASARGLNDEVASCVERVLRGTSFPAPTSGTVSATAAFRMAPGPASTTP